MDIPQFERPYPTGEVDEFVRTHGAAILSDVFTEQLRTRACGEIDRWLSDHPDAPDGASGISRGPHALRVTGLLGKLSCAQEVVTQPDILNWARRMLAPRCTRVLLNSAEYLERTPGERSGREMERPHRGTDFWPNEPIVTDPVLVHAIVALVPFTLGNGAMWLAMDSQWLPEGERPDPRTLARPIMNAGDAVVFRSDLIHGAGANVGGRRRRALSLGYRVDWLRPAENGASGVPPGWPADLSADVRAFLATKRSAC